MRPGGKNPYRRPELRKSWEAGRRAGLKIDDGTYDEQAWKRGYNAAAYWTAQEAARKRQEQLDAKRQMEVEEAVRLADQGLDAEAICQRMQVSTPGIGVVGVVNRLRMYPGKGRSPKAQVIVDRHEQEERERREAQKKQWEEHAVPERVLARRLPERLERLEQIEKRRKLAEKMQAAVFTLDDAPDEADGEA